MGFVARERIGTTTFTEAMALEAVERVAPCSAAAGAAREADVPTARRRKLPADVTLLWCVAMSLFTQQAPLHHCCVSRGWGIRYCAAVYARAGQERVGLS